MKLTKLDIVNFRNYSKLSLDFSDNINIFIGNNGEGKTNILESIYVLAITKSHRAYLDKSLIKAGCDFSKITGIVEKNSKIHKYDLIISQKGKRVSIDDINEKKISNYISKFKAILFCPDDLELIKELCVYDRSTKKSEKLLGLKDDLRSLISIKNSIVYYKTYDKVVAYDVDKQTKEEMDYMITSAVVVTCMVNGKIVIVGDGCVDMIDFDKKKVKKIVSQTECANDAVACTKDAVYYGVDSYNMNDILQKEKIQSKNNGLWKFDLQTGNKEKIREQSPKELHVLGNKLYDESLKEVRNGENK